MLFCITFICRPRASPRPLILAPILDLPREAPPITQAFLSLQTPGLSRCLLLIFPSPIPVSPNSAP